MGAYYDGWSVVLNVDAGSWAVSKETPFEFDIEDGATPALAKIDDCHFLCAYTGSLDNGYAGVLKLSGAILP